MESRRDAATWGFSMAFFCYQPYAATRRSISLCIFLLRTLYRYAARHFINHQITDH
jgi:hypothetical protein